MLARHYRLCKSSEFRRVREEGRCWSAPLLVVCKHTNGLAHSRFGFAVSKRIGRAVLRNQVKRRLRQAVRAQCDLVAPGWDVVFIARQRIELATYAEIEQIVSRQLVVAGLICGAERQQCERME